MDWNNINENKDTNGLGPIEYDQSKVPQLIRKHADNVRGKSYGQQVREAQARNAEYAGLIASESMSIASNADLLSKDTQNRFKDQIEGTTNSDEVIDARRPFGAESTFKTLGDRLNDISITPEYFSGTALEKLQKATNYILERGGGTVRCNKMYDITGLPAIKINKEGGADRRVVNFLGDGGGIVKNDEGTIFESDVKNSGDVYLTRMRFESVSGSGAKLLNMTNLIRVHWVESHASDIDMFASSDDFIQTLSFFGGTVVRGKGWQFNAPCYYDVTFGGGIVFETGEHFLKQEFDDLDQYKSVNGLRLNDCVIEGYSGKTFDLQRIESMKVDGLYLESNKGGYFDFSRADYIDTLDLKNLRVYTSTDVVERYGLTEVIKWGGRTKGVSTHNIFSRNLPIHNTTKIIDGYKVHSYQDVAMDSARNDMPNIDPNKKIVISDLDRVYQVTDSIGTFKATSETNFNDIYTTGSYHLNGASMDNAPATSWGILEVKKFNNGYFQQIFRCRGSAVGVIYERYCNSWEWDTKWRKYLATDKMFSPYNLESSTGQYTAINGPSISLDSRMITTKASINTDAPSSPIPGAYGVLEVDNLGSIIMQKVYGRSGALGQVYIRFYESGIWSAWSRIN